MSAAPSRWRRLLVEPRRPSVVRELPGAGWLAVGAVCVGAFMGQLDASIVTVALPTLQRTFHTSIGAANWVGLCYLLTLVATVVAVGRLADMRGRKLLYAYGFGVFVLGSAACGVAPDLATLCGFRVVQAVGAAMLQANSVAIVTLAVPARSLGRAIGIQGAAQAVGLAAGPTVGGLLLASGGWRLIFLVNVPFGILGTVAAVLLVPRSRLLHERVGFDWLGMGLFGPGIMALLLAVSFGQTSGWASPPILALLAAAATLGGLFLAWERRAAAPMIDLGLFAERRFSAGIGSGLLSYLVMFGVLFVVPYYLERGAHLGSGRAGVELMAMPAALALAAPPAGRLADRIGARPLTVGGMLVTAAAVVALGTLRPATAGFVALLAVIGAGLGCFTPPNNAAIMGAAPPEQAGMASGTLNMTRGVGTALGLAVTGLAFAAAGGESVGAGRIGHAFLVSTLVLAALAVAAAAVAGLRGTRRAALPTALPAGGAAGATVPGGAAQPRSRRRALRATVRPKSR